jgi:hypothetical protein
MKRTLAMATLALMCYGSAYSQKFSENLLQLADWMTGSFDSRDQAKSDTAFYPITLQMTRIWPEQQNGIWLYVEQAMATQPNKPYRQRIYFLSEAGEDEYTSEVYHLPNEEKYIGAWKNPAMLADLNPFEIEHKSGCTVFLFFDGFQYGGKTNTGSCKSDMRGASYATSEVVVLSDQISTLDRGYNSSGAQVWGSEKGPYIFKKR